MDSGFTPIYQKLTNHYREMIIKQELPPNSRMDSINKMMKRHDVSRETAKLVLKQLIRAGLVESKVGKGSFVTPQVRIKKEWGIVIPYYSSNIESLIELVNREATKNNRKISYYLTYNDPEEEIRLVGSMVRNGLEAIIIVPNFDESLTASFYRNLKHGKSTIVLIDNTMAGSYFNYVIQSYDLGVKRAFDYLTGQNEKNLLFVKSEPWKRTNMVYRLMEQTLQLLVNQRTPIRKLHVLSDLTLLNKAFIQNNNIGGVLACSDAESLKIAGRLKQWGFSMPDQVSLVSYGNTELTAMFDPPITSVDCRYDEMAKITASLIFDEKKKYNPEQHVIQPVLQIRET